MGRLPERDIRAQDEASGRFKWRPEQRGDRGDLHPRLHRRPLPGVHRPRPLHQLRLRAEGDLLQRGQHLDQLAGADRRRRRRQSDRDRSATATRPRSPSPSTATAGRSTTTPSPRSGRGSSSRATSSSTSTPAARARRNWAAATRSRSATPRPRSSSTRSSPRCSRRCGPTSAACSRAIGDALTHKPTAAEDATQLPEVQGKTGAEGAQRRLQLRRPGRPLQRPGRPTPCSAPARTTSRALVAGAGRTFGAFARHEADLAGPDRQLRHLHRRPRRPVGEPLDDDPPPRADPADRPRARWSASTATLPPLRAYAIELTAGDRRAAGADRRRQTVARAGASAALRQGGRRRRQAAGRSDPGPRRRRPGGQGERAAAAQPDQPLHEQGLRPDRQPDDQRPLQHRRAQLPRVLLRAGRTSPARARTSTATAPTCACSRAAATCWCTVANPKRQLSDRQTGLRATPPRRRSASSRSSAAARRRSRKCAATATPSPTSTARSARSARPHLSP